jgi:hypothetical protein
VSLSLPWGAFDGSGASEEKIEMARLSWPASGSTSFAISRIAAREGHWLISKSSGLRPMANHKWLIESRFNLCGLQTKWASGDPP